MPVTRSRFALALLCAAVAAPGRAAAADGIVEIDQTRAVAGGVTPGDAAGFPVTLSEPGSYRLMGSLLVPAGTPSGVEITADDVSLDLGGFSIVGPGGTTTASGISFSGRFNVEVRNGAIEGMGNGVYGDGRGHRVLDLRVSGAARNWGIRLTGDSHLVEGCTVSASDTGISTGPGSLVRRNSVTAGTGYGVLVDDASVVVENVVAKGDYGIVAGDGSVVAGCSALGSSIAGILAGNGSSLTQNSATGNASTGIGAGAGAVVARNSSVANGTGIFVLEGGAIRGNTVSQSSGDGIRSQYGSGVVIDNSVTRSDGYGLRVLGGSNIVLFTGNTLLGNASTVLGGYSLPPQSNLCGATTCP
jgi:hypothetical protein